MRMTTHAETLLLARAIAGPRYAALSPDQRATLSKLAGLRLDAAQTAQDYHHSVATSETYAIADGQGATYKASQAQLLDAYRLAFPDVRPEDVYDVWLDCMESAAYCAQSVRERGPLHRDF